MEDRLVAATVGDLEQVWVADTGGGSVGDPVTSVRGVHANTVDAVFGFRADTGAQLWAYAPGGSLEMEPPYVRGEEVWASALDTSDPAGVGPTTVLDAETGAVRGDLADARAVSALRGNRAAFWRRAGVAVIDVLDLDTSTWICCDDLLFGAAGERPRWPVTLGEELLFDAGYGLTHLERDDIGNGVRGYRITPPRPCAWIPIGMCPMWVTPLDGTTSTVPVLSDDESTVYVGTDAGTVYAVDATAGAVLWSAPVGSAVTDAPALADDLLFVPTAANGLVVLDATGCGSATCTPLWVGATGGPVTQQPAAVGGEDGVVFAGTADGSVVAFPVAGCDAATCSPRWTASTGSEITGAPAVSNAQLYVGTADGRLVAYGLPA